MGEARTNTAIVMEVVGLGELAAGLWELADALP